MSAPDARIATLEAQLVECEARAERYRKALHVAAGMPAPVSAPVPAPAAAAPAKPQVPAKVPEPVEAEGELKLIDGDLYMVKNGNVYEYDQMTEKKGDFVGRLKADESINTNAAEVMKGGSRKTRTRKGRRSSKNRKTRSQNRSRRH